MKKKNQLITKIKVDINMTDSYGKYNKIYSKVNPLNKIKLNLKFTKQKVIKTKR